MAARVAVGKVAQRGRGAIGATGAASPRAAGARAAVGGRWSRGRRYATAAVGKEAGQAGAGGRTEVRERKGEDFATV